MYKLLIADDEAKIRDGLVNYIPWDTFGFQVVAEGENGKQVLDYIFHHPVDVVLCDIKMPIMSGIELASVLYEQRHKTKVVFLSAYKDFEYAQKAIVYGVRNYIIKPTKFNELLNTFSKIRDELDLEKNGSKHNVDNNSAPEVIKSLGYHDKIINTAKTYVNKNYKDANLKKAAELIHMNTYYFSRFFKQKTGQNFSEYVISVKFEKAAELLRDVKYKTYEVGMLVGYDNAHNFSRAFKNYYGITPTEYREKPF